MTTIELPPRGILAHRFFTRPDAEPTTGRTIGWWEARRVPYNLAVGAAGVVSLGIVVICELVVEKFQHVSAGPMPDPPLFLVAAVVAYGIGANVCYTLGWIVELLARWLWRGRIGQLGPITFALGFVFSIGLTLVPGLLVICSTIVGLVVGPSFWSSGT